MMKKPARHSISQDKFGVIRVDQDGVEYFIHDFNTLDTALAYANGKNRQRTEEDPDAYYVYDHEGNCLSEEVILDELGDLAAGVSC